MDTDPTGRPDATSAIEQVKWLAAGSAKARDLLLRHAVLKSFERHQLLFHRGDAVDLLWVVIRGQLELSVVGADGRRFVAAQVPPGEAVGFIPLIDRRGAIHDARAVMPTLMLGLPREAFLAALQADVELLQSVLRLLLERGRRLNEWRAEITMRPLAARLARLLLGLAGAFGSSTEDGSSAVAITQDDLAAMLGVTRQALNPGIKALERNGLVELAYKRVLLRDRAGLRRLADESAG